jgi:hypothetical protein
MDLKLNFQGLKHNFKNVQGVFVKLQVPVNFWNYFSIEKIEGIGPRSVDRVHNASVHRSTRLY